MPGEPKKKQKRIRVPLGVYIDPDLAHDVQRFIEESEPTVSRTALVEAALRAYLHPRLAKEKS